MTTDQTAELASSYDPTEAETKWYPIWKRKVTLRQLNPEGEPYTIVIPPPNVTVPCPIWGMHSP